MTVDHLSKIVTKFQGDDKPINGDFLEDAPFIIEKLTWFAHIVNFIPTRKMLEDYYMCTRSYENGEKLARITRRGANLEFQEQLLVMDGATFVFKS
ncbi:hypothetical protein CK203_087468 [Vitis vinifera]|uniref:Uncharacterized protein n=1 Tax=Vitis vinifera TaxID=29760 RepID=A0A438EN84_VITVI|nr:hypothetical protein CK203_087468 [Vitis vinifera]